MFVLIVVFLEGVELDYLNLAGVFFPPLYSLIICDYIVFLLGVAKVHHGYLPHADGSGDWVLTIFTALSLVSEVYLLFFSSATS